MLLSLPEESEQHSVHKAHVPQWGIGMVVGHHTDTRTGIASLACGAWQAETCLLHAVGVKSSGTMFIISA